MKDGSIMVIGIAGGTGSGKTTITRKIMQHFGGNVSVIYHDNYYKAHHGMSYEERAKLNYDHPDAFDTDLLIEDIKRLRRGETVHCPTYDYTIHDRAEKTAAGASRASSTSTSQQLSPCTSSLSSQASARQI